MQEEKHHKISNKKKFSIIARIRSTDKAWRGLGIIIRSTHNLWFQIFFAVLAIYVGFAMRINTTEWALIVFAIGIVIIAEILNTAIEIDVDLTSPNYHPLAKDIKDISAGAVLFSAFLAGTISLLIFLPKFILLF
ncbi:MAG TPA: diacylglycerol kinase family protein [Candidatus Paceibacterota bacterium]|nr:diacylglycerol kinase family protein [Candidatus Paceibacterota bacterium]